MKVVVIGAGPAGLAAGYQLAKKGVHVEVLEASGEVGGLARTFELWGQKVDVGPHRFFSDDIRVNSLWLEVVQSDYSMVNRLTRIYYQGKMFQYPLQAVDALAKLGIIEAGRCMLSYLEENIRKKNGVEPPSFEDWVTSRFGKRLFEIFFKSYSEKLWGIPCDQLDSDFASQRIKKFSLYEAVRTALGQGKNFEHKTLVDRFAYPHGGSGMVYKRMAQSIVEKGGRVLLESPVRRVHLDRGRAVGVKLKDGSNIEADHVVSSMPLTLLVKSMEGVPSRVVEAASSLRFRNTIIVYLNVAKPDVFSDNWIYIHSPDLQMGRVTNFRNWVPHLYGDSPNTILALEYWCNGESDFWRRPDADLISLAEREIRKSGLIGAVKILAGYVCKIPRSYPVYQRGYRENVREIAGWLDSIHNLNAIGRYGSFKYNNQDHSLLMGLLAAENILGQNKVNLWDINTDLEYQETAYITDTGLMRSSKPVQPEISKPIYS